MTTKLLAPILILGLSASSAAASMANDVLKSCIRGADLRPAAVETTRGTADGVSYARVEAGGPVTETLARAINACADRHGGNTTVPKVATLATSGHTSGATATDTGIGSVNPRFRPPYFRNPDPFPQWRSAPQCNDTATYVYRGNLYCFAGR